MKPFPLESRAVPGVSDLSVFAAALVAVYLLPGPDMALVMSTAIGQGTRNGLMAAGGLAGSRALHVSLSGAGLAALLAAHPALLTGVRWVGALYLLWLAWKVAGSSGHFELGATTRTASAWDAARRGVLTNLLNPKALMFCALLLPQFIHREHGSLLAQYLLLGAILVGLGLAFDVAYVLLAGRLSATLAASPTAQRVQRLAFATIFGLAALRLMASER